MELTIIISILGIVLTAISLILYFTYFYTGKISFLFENSISLLDSLTKSFSDFSIKYKEKDINQGLILVTGYFINTGKKDLTKNMIDEPLSILLPEQYSYHEINIKSKSDGFEPNVELNEKLNKVTIDWTLFRRNEYFKIEALIEVPFDNTISSKTQFRPKEVVKNNIMFMHRISDTEDINFIDLNNLLLNKSVNIWQPKNLKQKLIQFIGAILIFFVIPLSIIILMEKNDIISNVPEFKCEINYSLEEDSKKRIASNIEVVDDSTIIIRSVDNSYYRFISIDDFLKSKEFNAKLRINSMRPKYDFSGLGMMFSGIMATLFLITMYIINYFKKIKIKAIIKELK
jgi:hypothetical protein